MGAGLAQWNISRYDPVIGRFMAVDPVEPDPERSVHTLNRYAYANNNPYKYVDPDGRFAVMTTIAIATIAYSAYQGYQDGGATGALAEASGYNDAVASYHSFRAGDYSGAILAAGMATIKPFKAVKKVKDLNPLHLREVVGDRPDLRGLSDKELLNSVISPKHGDRIKINTKTGKVVDGNSRTYELKRRAEDPNSSITSDTEVPYNSYTPDDSMFWDM